MSNEPEPLFISKGQDAPRTDLLFIEREAVTAVVYDPKTKMYLALRWKQVNWETFVTGGIEEGQTPEMAAVAEVREETGYTDLKLLRELPRYHSKFYHAPKGVNRFAHFRCFLFELASNERTVVSEVEIQKHEALWLTREELATFNLPEGHVFLVESL